MTVAGFVLWRGEIFGPKPAFHWILCRSALSAEVVRCTHGAQMPTIIVRPEPVVCTKTRHTISVISRGEDADTSTSKNHGNVGRETRN